MSKLPRDDTRAILNAKGQTGEAPKKTRGRGKRTETHKKTERHEARGMRESEGRNDIIYHIIL
jgi:hypothetical protein